MLCKIILLISPFFYCTAHALSIAEKQAALLAEASNSGSSDELQGLCTELQDKSQQLKMLYTSSYKTYEEMSARKATTDELEVALRPQLNEMAKLKKEIRHLQQQWKEAAQERPTKEQEGIWHQPDTTVGQLVIDYGSSDYVYAMPPEISTLKIHVSSELPVPKSSWDEMLRLILSYYGVGIKEPMPFLRQLYYMRINNSGFSCVSDSRAELEVLPVDAKVMFFLLPQPTDVKRISYFLEKFSAQEQMTVQMVGNAVVLIGYVREILELLKVYDFISTTAFTQTWKIVSLQKAQGEDIAKILYSIFDTSGARFSSDGGEGQGQSSMGPVIPFAQENTNSFRVIVLKHPAQSLFLIGQPDQIEKATQVIQEIETRIGEVHEKTVWWYACKHSEAQDLAEVLNAVYQRIVAVPDAFALGGKKRTPHKEAPKPAPVSDPDGGSDRLIVYPPKIGPGEVSPKKKFQNNDNFIVDTKTNSIVMVVETYVLPKLKTLMRKLDVPKRMVQIEVLLFEKRFSDNNSFGLNLLKLGEAVAHKHSPRLLWNDRHKKKHHRENSGILQFTYSRDEHDGFPAFAIAYNFLLTQEDIQINACPTMTTVNQTPVKFAVVDQMSINTGVVEIDTTKATRLKDSYVREEYGITIQVTPTIHAKIDDESDLDAPKFVTLSTDIVFDTTKPNRDSRPDVTRRNIKNEIRIADGETVILGGLRKKTAQENQETVPFLGEIPGVGKLFGNTSFSDSNTEMFIFLTPRIIPEQTEEFRKLRQQELAKRPGDIPEFLEEVLVAKKAQKRAFFERSLKLILGTVQE